MNKSDLPSALAQVLQLLPQSKAPFVVDGGFHLGSYSQGILDHFPDAQILGFEPDPDTYAKALRGNVKRNLDIRNVALGAEETVAEFYRGSRAATNSLLPRPVSTTLPYYPHNADLTGGMRVPVVRLDDVLRDQGDQRLDLLKLDLQGGELAALKGAQETLKERRVRIIQCEVVFVEKYENQPLHWEVCQFLSKFGYRFHSFSGVVVGPYDICRNAARKAQWNQADAFFLSLDEQDRIDVSE